MINNTVIAAALHSSLVKRNLSSYKFINDEVAQIHTLWPKSFIYRVLESPRGPSASFSIIYTADEADQLSVEFFLVKLKDEFDFGQDITVDLDPKPTHPDDAYQIGALRTKLKVKEPSDHLFSKYERKLIASMFPDLVCTYVEADYSNKRNYSFTHKDSPETWITAYAFINLLGNHCGFGTEDGFDKPTDSKDDSDKPIAGALLDFSRALTEVSKLSTFGAAKYSRSSWLEVDNGQERYTDAMVRHLLLEATEDLDPETSINHDVAVVWNALARLELRLRDLTNA